MGKNINFNKIQKEDICNKYLSGLSTNAIAKECECSNVTIGNILKSKNIEIRSRRKFELKTELEICDKYKNGADSYKLSKTYKCSVSAIIGALKRNGVKMRSNGESHKKYSLNESYFDVIDSEDKAYWLGWFYSDGCNEKNHTVSITLNEKDKYIIELFKKYIGSNRPLYIKKHNKFNSTCYSLQLRSKQMSDSLKELGCVYNKSLILEFPNNEQVSNELLPHFIRGYLEGDGCVGVYKTRNMIHILGTKCFLDTMKKYLESNGISRIYANPATKNTWSLTIWRRNEILKFKELIYDNYLVSNSTNSELILNRKYDKLLEIESIKF